MNALRRPAAHAILMLLAIALGAGCHRRAPQATPAPGSPPASVRVQVAELKKRLATEEVAGTVRAKLVAHLEAKVAGRILEMVATPGKLVEAGELLVRLDVGEIQARRDQALVQRDQAERELKRYATLVEQKAVTRQEFEVVEARDRGVRAAVLEAETMLGYARIAAPFKGVITRKLADVGDLAAPGKPLVELENPDTFRLEANVPEALMGRIRLEVVLPVRLPALGLELNGKVSEIAPASDPNSRTFKVMLELPATEGLRTGQFGRVAVPVAETTTLRVPAGAMVQRGQLELVFVVTDKRAVLRLVRAGKRIGEETEIASGLSPGEAVVVENAASLVDGQAVEIKP